MNIVIGGAAGAFPPVIGWVAVTGHVDIEPLVLFALTTILASGAAIGTQIGVALVFIVVSLAVVEVVLLCNVVSPVKTQAALRKVHDRVGGYRQQIVVAIVTLVGLAFVAQGTGLLA